MTDQFDPARLRELHEAATPGPWGVWREPIGSVADAMDELALQAQATDPIIDAVVLIDAGGKCPAITGCGPTSDANAALIVALRNAAPATLAMADENAALKAEVARLLRHIAAIGEAIMFDDKTAIPGIIRSAANG